MNVKLSLSLITEIENMIDMSRDLAVEKGCFDFWKRDHAFIKAAKECILSDNVDCLNTLLNEFRNLSQGFCSYSDEVQHLDELIDVLYSELQSLYLNLRALD